MVQSVRLNQQSEITEMGKIVFGVISLTVGFLLIVNNKSFARYVITQQTKFWSINLGQRDLKFTEIFSIAGGIIFILFGLFSLLQIIHFK